MQTPINAARQYAALGYPVLPIKAGTKRPLLHNGLHGATTDKATLAEWFRRWPRANVAIRTDAVLVIDLDPGATWPREELRMAIKEVKPALQRTPRGGWHIIFRLPQGKCWRPQVGALAEHVDTRTGPGSHLLVSPSQTEAGAYRWVRPLRPAEELPLPPAELIEALDQLERPKAVFLCPRSSAWIDGPIPVGQRNDRLFRLGCRLRAQGMGAAEILAHLQAVNATWATPPLPDAEVQAIAASAAKYQTVSPALTAWRSRAVKRLRQQRGG